MVEQRKQAAAQQLLEAYRRFQRAQQRAWSDRGADGTDRAAYVAARAELERAEREAIQIAAR